MCFGVLTFMPMPRTTKTALSGSPFNSVRIPPAFLSEIKISFGHFISAWSPENLRMAFTALVAATSVILGISFGRISGRRIQERYTPP